MHRALARFACSHVFYAAFRRHAASLNDGDDDAAARICCRKPSGVCMRDVGANLHAQQTYSIITSIYGLRTDL